MSRFVLYNACLSLLLVNVNTQYIIYLNLWRNLEKSRLKVFKVDKILLETSPSSRLKTSNLGYKPDIVPRSISQVRGIYLYKLARECINRIKRKCFIR